MVHQVVKVMGDIAVRSWIVGSAQTHGCQTLGREGSLRHDAFREGPGIFFQSALVHRNVSPPDLEALQIGIIAVNGTGIDNAFR